MAEYIGKLAEQIKHEFPLVSIICLCYNHENFIEEAMASVLGQSYTNLEIIVIDDASVDQSSKVIDRFLASYHHTHHVHTLFLPENVGNCKAFNQGLALAKGKYVIDFATDDVMLPQRVEQQVTYFEQLPSRYGVVFSEAAYIDEKGKHLYFHYQDRLKRLRPIPAGNVYAQVLALYFISSPTMMVKKEVLDDMGGYDERLAYEDFDFWVRSSRQYLYAYLPACTTKVRKSAGSMSTKIYTYGDKQLYSTYLICKKAAKLIQTSEERLALIKRIKFELRQAVFFDNRTEAKLFFSLLQKHAEVKGRYLLLYAVYQSGVRLHWISILLQRCRNLLMHIYNRGASYKLLSSR